MEDIKSQGRLSQFNCCSDIGSVLVGNKEVRFALPNIGGDGTTKLFVFDDDMSFRTHAVSNIVDFVTSIEGKFNVFSYDCSRGNDEDVIATLEGRYGVYRGEWIVVLVKRN